MELATEVARTIVFYGEAGPGRLYRRQHLPADRLPELSALHLDESKVDFWGFR